MAENYCGKSCDQCADKELLGCPGCKVGPGNMIGTACEVARCCIIKGQSQCTGCEFCNDCYTLAQKDQFLQHRVAAAEKDKSGNEMLSANAPALAKWLNVAFWLIVPSVISSFLSNESFFGSDSIIPAVGQMLSSTCVIIYGLVLLRLGFVDKRYKFAALCVLAGAVISSATNYMFSGKEVPMWAMAISVPTTAISFVGEYFTFSAHSTVLSDVNHTMSTKWKTLWKWYFGSCIAHYSGVLLSFVIPSLGVMLINAGDVGTIITRLLNLLYLQKTVKFFRSHSAG